MADINYNELTHSIVYTDGTTAGPVPDPMFHWDVRFPERLTRLRLSPEFSRLSLGLGLSAIGSAGVGVGAGSCHSPVGKRQNRRSRADRAAASSGRYRTQPITFDEIAEVDEDSGVQGGGGSSGAAVAGGGACEGGSTTGSGTVLMTDDGSGTKDSKASFKTQMANFSRSMDGLMPGYIHRAATVGGVLSGSDKENTPCDPDFVASSPTTSAASFGLYDAGNDNVNMTADMADTTTAEGNPISFQMPSIVDSGRHRRKRSGRRLRNRNSVPEEVMPEQGDRAEVDVEPEASG